MRGADLRKTVLALLSLGLAAFLLLDAPPASASLVDDPSPSVDPVPTQFRSGVRADSRAVSAGSGRQLCPLALGLGQEARC